MKKTVLVTGASGFVGRHFLESLGERYHIYAVARRSPRDVGTTLLPNIRWIRLDIGDEPSVRNLMEDIGSRGGADFVFHLAAYYDFTNQDNIEYHRTNVEGTRNLLKHAHLLNLKRFIFSSSLTVSEFPGKDGQLTEESPLDANIPYAQSKRKGEELVAEYSRFFPCAIVRMAAVFSDWCEYAPLYHLLDTWLSRSWKCRLLAGRGETSLPYLHVQDLNAILLRIAECSRELPALGVYIAGPDGCTSHRTLYEIAVRYYYGYPRRPLRTPKLVIYPALYAMDAIGLLLGKRPFEKPWMLKYVDRKMSVQASLTRQTLEWQSAPRFNIRRRLLFLIENMKCQPYEWRRKNEVAHRTVEERKGFKIFRRLSTLKERTLRETFNIVFPVIAQKCPSSPAPGLEEELRNRLEFIFIGLEIAVRIGDRRHILSYVHQIADFLRSRGICCEDSIQMVFVTMEECIVDGLLADPELKGMDQRIHDVIGTTFQLVADEVEEICHSAKHRVT